MIEIKIYVSEAEHHLTMSRIKNINKTQTIIFSNETYLNKLFFSILKYIKRMFGIR